MVNIRFKFRAWDGKQMNHDVCYIPAWGAIKNSHFGTAWTDEARAGEIMQFIGKTDIAGKEVYEGDIVSYKREKAKKALVSWDAEGCCFMLGEDEIGINIKDIYVLGNRYENPELLK
jgi:hypothetical protein